MPQNRETTHGVILGEGKPENQNSAIIFCFGEVLQAIDMNQDNYLAEALKVRSLIDEFNPPRYTQLEASAAAAVRAGRRAGRATTAADGAPKTPVTPHGEELCLGAGRGREGGRCMGKGQSEGRGDTVSAGV